MVEFCKWMQFSNCKFSCSDHHYSFFPETSRHEFRHGKVESAAASIAKFYGVSTRHTVVKKQLEEMREKLRLEQEGGDHSIWEVFTGPRMAYRTLLGVSK